MLHLSDQSAVRDGLVTVDHSVAGVQKGGAIDPSRIAYAIINPHGPGGNFVFPDAVARYLPQDAALFQRYINSENDTGVHALVQTFLDKNPGGVALTVEPSRGVVDLNRTNAHKAIRGVLHPDAPEAVRDILRNMHGKTLHTFDYLVNALSPHAAIWHLHSMEPFSTPKQPKITHDNLVPFLDAFKTRELSDATRRKTDIIIGTNEKDPVADMVMSQTFYDLLLEHGFPVDFNGAYDTDADYPDYDHMVRFPDRVFAVDLLKTDLAVGSGEDRSFDTTNAVVSERKVLAMAELLQEAMRISLRKRALEK